MYNYCVIFIYDGNQYSQRCYLSLELTRETNSLILDDFANFMIEIYLQTNNLKKDGLKAHHVEITTGENMESIYKKENI